MLCVSVDFNTAMMDGEGRVYIARDGDPGDLDLAERLRPGLPVLLQDVTPQVEATAQRVELYEGHTAWPGVPDWSTRRDLGEASVELRAGAGRSSR